MKKRLNQTARYKEEMVAPSLQNSSTLFPSLSAATASLLIDHAKMTIEDAIREVRDCA